MFAELGAILESFYPVTVTTDVPKGSYLFQKEHPLSSTHHIVYRDQLKAFIPNFIRSVLPRQDHGDYEYYCCTMLTLFHPWRTGMELKLADDTWSSSFSKYSFTSCQLEIMQHFNLRYECLDARDDFELS